MILNGSNGVLGACDDVKAVRRGAHHVAVAHPDLEARWESCEQFARSGHVELGPAILVRRRGFDRPPEKIREVLEAITDAENRYAELEPNAIRVRRFVLVHRARTPRKDDPPKRTTGNRIRFGVERDDFAVDTDFADAPGDQLCVL